MLHSANPNVLQTLPMAPGLVLCHLRVGVCCAEARFGPAWCLVEIHTGHSSARNFAIMLVKLCLLCLLGSDSRLRRHLLMDRASMLNGRAQVQVSSAYAPRVLAGASSASGASARHTRMGI